VQISSVRKTNLHECIYGRMLSLLDCLQQPMSQSFFLLVVERYDSGVYRYWIIEHVVRHMDRIFLQNVDQILMTTRQRAKLVHEVCYIRHD
jgi:hypothetical protein